MENIPADDAGEQHNNLGDDEKRRRDLDERTEDGID
jgi:hypothetical protein